MDLMRQIDDPRNRGVLVVDDDPGPRASVQFILKSRQYTNLHFACDGVDALEKLEELGPSVYLVLLDLRMPRMDGITFLKHLGERQGMQPIGIIVMTGYPTPDGQQEVFGLETKSVRPLHYLSKPFDMSELLNGVTESLAVIHRLRCEG